MNVFSLANLFSWVLVLLPLILILLSIACAYVPGAPEFLTEFFVNLFGEVELFGNAAQMLSILYDSEKIQGDSLAAFFLNLLFSSLTETMIISCCIFAVKITFMSLRRARANTFGGIDQIFIIWRYPVFVLTAAGVALGVLFCSITEELIPQLRGLLTALVPMGIIGYGIFLMFRSAGMFPREKQRANTYGVFVKLFGEILGGILITLCMVLCVICLFVGPGYVRNGMPVRVLLAWYGLGILGIYLTFQLLQLMRPRKYNNRGVWWG